MVENDRSLSKCMPNIILYIKFVSGFSFSKCKLSILDFPIEKLILILVRKSTLKISLYNYLSLESWKEKQNFKLKYVLSVRTMIQYIPTIKRFHHMCCQATTLTHVFHLTFDCVPAAYFRRSVANEDGKTLESFISEKHSCVNSFLAVFLV